MDTITSLVGVLETELEGGEPTTSLSSLNALYALYALQNRAEAAEAEVGRLQAALDQWKQRGDAIMLCATGRAAPLSDWDDTSYAHVMAAVDRAAAAIIPQDPGGWADWVVYLLEALDANGEIETRGYDFYAVLRSLQDAINERKLNGRW